MQNEKNCQQDQKPEPAVGPVVAMEWGSNSLVGHGREAKRATSPCLQSYGYKVSLDAATGDVVLEQIEGGRIDTLILSPIDADTLSQVLANFAELSVNAKEALEEEKSRSGAIVVN